MQDPDPIIDRWSWPFWLLVLAVPVSVAGSGIAFGVLLLTAVMRATLLRARTPLPPRPITILVLLVLTTHALATVLAAEMRWDKWVDELWIDLLVLAVPVVMAARPRAAGRAMAVLLTLGSIVAIYGTVQHWTGVDLIRDRHTNGISPGRYIANGFFDHHLTYGGSVLVVWTLAAAAVVQYGFSRDRRAALAWCALICTSSGLFFSFARSAQIGALAAGLLLLTGLHGRGRWMSLGAVAGAAALAPLSPGFRHRFGELFSLETEETRFNLWRSTWNGILERPWTGWGPGNFHRMLERHEVEGFYESRAHAHSDLLMHWVNAGILGLTAYLALALVIGVWLWRHRERAGAWAFVPAAAAALQLAFFVAGLFQVYQSDDEVEFALFLVTGTALALLIPARGRLDEG